MQKRSLQPYKIEYFSISLDPEFPIFMDDLDLQSDRDITFLHYHQCFELGYCHSGSGVFVIENKVLPFHQGCITVISHNETHLAQSARGTKSKWTWLYFDPVLLMKGFPADPLCLRTENFSGPKFNNIIPPDKCPLLRTSLLRMIDELRGRNKFRTSGVRSLALSIMVDLHRHYTTRKLVSVSSARGEIGRIAPALQLMARSYDQTLDIPRLSKACALSTTQFRRVFRQITHHSPLRYLTRLRLQMAAALLTQSSRRIIDISQDVGYPTLSSFNRHFQKQFHTNPRQWRKKNSL